MKWLMWWLMTVDDDEDDGDHLRCLCGAGTGVDAGESLWLKAKHRS